MWGNCIECPRYNAHSEAELRDVAELWYRTGWLDTVLSNDEIACRACSEEAYIALKKAFLIRKTILKNNK